MSAKGNKTKRLLKRSREKSKAPIEAINQDILDVAQLDILSDVLTNTAVAGNHHISPDPILARAFHKTSLFL